MSAEIRDAAGRLAYGVTPNLTGAPVLGPRGLPLIQISDLALSS